MQKNLLSIFNAITPDNIKDIPIIAESMQIFIELLEEYGKVSIDIKEALSENTTDAISEELVKIYMYDYYSMIENLRSNKYVVKQFKEWNDALTPNLYPKGLPEVGGKNIIGFFTIGEETENPDEIVVDDNSVEYSKDPLSFRLNELSKNILSNKPENYFVNREFKQSKGLKKSINYIYDMINKSLNAEEERRALEFTETGKPFELKINGSISKNVYKESVGYIAHPLGFTYDYTYISELRFIDRYGMKKHYKVNQLEVRCLYGNVEKYEKDVVLIIDKNNYLKIVFSDGTYLLQENNTVKYMDVDNIIIKYYPPKYHCSIYIDYEIIYNTLLVDTLKFKVNKTFDFGFVVGSSVVGEGIIGKDSDVYETLNLEDTTKFDVTKMFPNGFIIGDVIGDKLITSDSDIINVINYNDTLKDALNYKISDDFLINVSDTLVTENTKNFNFGFIVGDTVGDKLITNDSDGAFLLDTITENNIELKSEFDFGMIIGSDFVGDLGIRNDTDKIELYKDEFSINDSPDEVYNIDEEFDIQVL